jgi:hypothetical protein
MKTIEESRHQEQLLHSNSPSRKKHYEAPKFTILKLDRVKAQLVARALAGDRDAEDLLEASVNSTSASVSYTKG